MDKFDKKYNWKESKSKLNEFEPKDSLWDAISSSLDTPEPLYDFEKVKDNLSSFTPDDKLWSQISDDLDTPPTPEPLYDFNQLKEKLSVHSPGTKIWEGISDDLDTSPTPEPLYDFNQLKEKLSVHSPDTKIWEGISESLDTPRPIYDFAGVADNLVEHTPDSSLWDAIENGLDIDQQVEQLPSHEPPAGIWDSIEEDLEDVKGGISFLRSAIMVGISMVILIGAALMLNQDKTKAVENGADKVKTTIENSTMQFASNENYQIEWSDDEDVRLIQEMCQDYMAVCEQPKFKELETELHELNDHKKELLDMVSAFDEESSYGPMLAKIETQKTALMKEMISMI